MRLRFPELLDERELTAYQLVQMSSGRITLSTAYRANRLKGRLKLIDATFAEEVCSALGIGPDELFELESTRKRTKK
jgi:major membrane immunogen (membrane-anchored lipoprotein)